MNRISLGIGTALAKWRAQQLTHGPSLWALCDSPELGWYTTFWSLEDALRDRAQESETVALVRSCELALPRAKDMERFTDELSGSSPIYHFNEHAEDVADFSDYARNDPVCEFRLRAKGEPDPTDDLARRFAIAFREWVLAHGGATSAGEVSWGAWRFTGPLRRFEIVGAGKSEPNLIAVPRIGRLHRRKPLWWIEVCAKCESPLPKLGDTCEVCG